VKYSAPFLKKEFLAMKKVILSILTFCVVVAIAATGSATITASAIPPRDAPANVYAIPLAGKGGGSAQDTIGATYSNIYGPYQLSKDPKRQQVKFMRCYTRTGTLPATCTTAVDYQILPTTSLSDTSPAKWVTLDSIKAAAGANGGVDTIDAIPGMSIVFRLHCLTNSSTAAISKPIKILLSGSASESTPIK
jgi:hypothetical protein